MFLLNADGGPGQHVLQMEDMQASAPQPSHPQQQGEHEELEVYLRAIAVKNWLSG